jgi:S-formylglutathione hydrolase FrmB
MAEMILHGMVYSKKLEMDTGISVVVPNEFDKGNEYKVVYLLHGIHGDNHTWVDNSMLPVYSRGKNIVFVMPSALRSFYTDTKSGQRYYSYVAHELPNIIESVFHVTAARRQTGIMGCSMGGYGALKIGLSNPEKFGFIGATSSALMNLKVDLAKFKDEEKKAMERLTWGDQMVDDMTAIFGPNGEYNPKDDVLELAKGAAKSGHNTEIYMACGHGDPFYKDNKMAQAQMGRAGLDITFEEWNGYHDWFFFDEALKRSIEKFDDHE